MSDEDVPDEGPQPPNEEPQSPISTLDLPSVTDLLNEFGGVVDPDGEASLVEDDFRRMFSGRAIPQQEGYERLKEYVHVQGLRDHYELKASWSKFLMRLLGSMIVFQWVLLGMVGFGWWDFADYDWLLPILLVQNLGQILGLAYVVVKSLFKDLNGSK